MIMYVGTIEIHREKSCVHDALYILEQLGSEEERLIDRGVISHKAEELLENLNP